MRLLIVADYFYPHWTGYAKSMYYVVKALQHDFSILVLTVRHKKNLRREEMVHKVRVMREDYLFSLSRSKYSVSIILRLILLVRNYDVVFVNSPCANILPFSIISKLFRKKLLIFHHGDLILPRGLMNSIVEKIFDVSSLLSFLLANKLSTITQDYAENSRILKHFLYKLHPLIFPICMERATKSSNGMLQVLRNKRREGNILIGFAGRFVEEKGFDILFDAIPAIIEKLPNVHFVFAGETRISYEDFYERNISKLRKVKEHITFLGLLTDVDLVVFYRLISFLILPSRSDCFPLVQAEAMFAKTPCLVSNIPGARYLVAQTGFGALFKKEDPEDLAKTVVEAIQRRKVILPNYKKVLSILNNRKNAKAFKKFIAG